MFSDLSAWYRKKTTELPDKSAAYEERVLLQYLTDPKIATVEKDPVVQELVYYIGMKKFKWMRGRTARDYISSGGFITLCDDIFGYEVKLLNGRQLLDCKPAYYNLSVKQGKLIYDALVAKFQRRNIKDED